MRLAKLQPMALACASVFLASCGGGNTNAIQQADNAHAQPASVVKYTTADTILGVSLKAGSDNQIEFTNASGTIISLTKAGGTVVTSIDDLPAAIANYSWTKSVSPSGHLRIRFTPGTYRLNSGWIWPADISGKDSNHQIVLEPSKTGDVVITGAEEKSGIYDSGKQLSTLSTDNRLFEQLWANGARAIRARTPDVGTYFYVKGGSQGWPQSAGSSQIVGSMDGADTERQTFQADDSGYAALAPLATTPPSTGDANGIIVMMHSWQVSKHKVTGLDASGKRIRISPAAYWPLGEEEGKRYFIENTESALNAPGEWFWSASGTTGLLKFKPFDSNTTIKFSIPRIEKLLTIQGDVDSGKWAQYVQFSTIKFRYTKVNMPTAGYIDGQADTSVSAAVELNDARNIQFSNCEVSHTGGYAFWLNKRVQSVWIEGSELFDLGAGGIKIGKSRPAQVFDVDWTDVNDPNNTGSNIIYNNRIHNSGHVYPGSVGIWVGRSSANYISNNLIKDTTYTGISVGWTWDTGPSMASGNYVGNNFLANIGLDALSDMGGIYTLGRSPDTTISGNVIKNVRAYDNQSGRGIYADEGSSELMINNNIVLGTDGAGFLLHYGENNTVQTNAFANSVSAFQILRRVAKDKPTTTTVPLTLADNRFFPQSNAMVGLSDDDTLMKVPSDASPSWVPTTPTLTGNKVSPQFLPTGASLNIPTSLCTGCAAASSLTITDSSLLTVPTVSDLALTKSSTVAKDWNTAALSPTTSAARIWAGNRANTPTRTMDFQASQWPLGSTAKPDGRPLPGWQVINQTKYYQSPTDNTVAVSIGDDGAGQHYLLLADTQRTDFGWEPFIQSWMRYASGTAKVTFTAKFDTATYLTHEWRSDDAGTTVGPRVSFVASGSVVNVIVNGVIQASVQPNMDATFEITAPIQAGQTWTLAITQGSINKIIPGLSPAHSNWAYVGPVLFISNANTKTTTAFKSIKIQKL